MLGTEATVKREYTRALIRDFAGDCAVTLVGSKRLACYAESELVGTPVDDTALAAEIGPCFVNHGARTDTVVLACTHYPLLLERLRRIAPWPVNFIDPAPAIARRVVDLLGPLTAGAGSSRAVFTSGHPPAAVLARFGIGTDSSRRDCPLTASGGRLAASPHRPYPCRHHIARGTRGPNMTAAVQGQHSAWYLNRWSQLILGIIAMMAISSPQYVWTLFTGPLNAKLGTTLAELQWTFSLLIILQTWLSPLQASLVDRFGPRLLIAIGAFLSGGSWVLSAYVDNVWALYFTYGVLGGFGTGIIYVGIVGLMVRWFPDRRGLATGLAAAGYGFGAFFTSFPIDSMIKSSGYAHTLVVWGIIQAVIGILAAQGLRTPPENYVPPGGAAVAP